MYLIDAADCDWCHCEITIHSKTVPYSLVSLAIYPVNDYYYYYYQTSSFPKQCSTTAVDACKITPILHYTTLLYSTLHYTIQWYGTTVRLARQFQHHRDHHVVVVIVIPFCWTVFPSFLIPLSFSLHSRIRHTIITAMSNKRMEFSIRINEMEAVGFIPKMACHDHSTSFYLIIPCHTNNRKVEDMKTNYFFWSRMKFLVERNVGVEGMLESNRIEQKNSRMMILQSNNRIVHEGNLESNSTCSRVERYCSRVKHGIESNDVCRRLISSRTNSTGLESSTKLTPNITIRIVNRRM